MQESNAQFVILGSGEYEYEMFFRAMQDQYPGRLCACFGFIPELSRKIYAAADIFPDAEPSEPLRAFSNDRPALWGQSR